MTPILADTRLATITAVAGADGVATATGDAVGGSADSVGVVPVATGSTVCAAVADDPPVEVPLHAPTAMIEIPRRTALDRPDRIGRRFVMLHASMSLEPADPGSVRHGFRRGS